MSECTKCGTSTCCDYSYGCFECAEDAAFEKGRKSMEAENAKLRRNLDNIKVRSYELGQRELHDMTLAALQEE